MNQVQVFSNNQLGEIRTLERDGEIWFVGKDVAEALGYSRATKAVTEKVDAEDRDEVPIRDSIGRNQKAYIINESGIYSLILSSKLPQAKEFKRWVTSEILPSVRKHGGYISGQEEISGEELMARAILFAERKIKEQAEQIALMEPKVAYFDTVTESAGSMSIRDTAKVLGVREKEFTAFLEEKKLCFRNRNGRGRLEPYAEYLHEKHWFEMTEFSVTKNGSTKSGFQTKITPMGRQKIHELMEKGGTT